MNISNVSFVKSITDLRHKPSGDLPEVAVAGRSNVGKSSLINSLFNRKNLAKTSAQPGKTRLINYFNIDDKLFLVDLPGYGYARVAKSESAQWKKMIENYIIKSHNLAVVWLLIDCRRKIMDKDQLMLDWMSHYNKNYFIILTKTDKVSKNQLKSIMNSMSQNYNCDFIPFSAKTGSGREELLRYLDFFVKKD